MIRNTSGFGDLSLDVVLLLSLCSDQNIVPLTLSSSPGPARADSEAQVMSRSSPSGHMNSLEKHKLCTSPTGQVQESSHSTNRLAFGGELKLSLSS